MNSRNICWHDNSKRFAKDSHAIFGASKHAWLNYSEDKMIEMYNNSKAKKVGTELHELACGLIKNRVKLPDENLTLNMYVNDAIQLGLLPEVQLYYSDLFYGTTDAIGVFENVLHIHDLKTGKIKASMQQLEIYAAFFFLEYDKECDLTSFKDIVLRIYQNNEKIEEHVDAEIILPIMDKIVVVNRIIEKMEEQERWIIS